MICITGDTHREFYRLNNLNLKNDDMLIILGDVGINYYLDESDKKLKDYLNKYGFKIFCIQGNHEERPENISSYHEVEMFGGSVFIEDEYPNLVFAKNGEVYDIGGKRVLVIGGAYSVDKYYRIEHGYKWFYREQLSEEEKYNILDKYSGTHIDIILSHTCPLKYEPKEVLMKGLDQSNVDKSMELFLDKVEKNINYDKWYCGHYHTEKIIDKIEFMFGRVKDFNTSEFVPKYGYNGYEIIRDAYSKDEVFLKEYFNCPKCNSTNIILQKGDGFNINGDDFIGIICNDCKKVYGFNDVNYKYGCPKEL